MLGTQAMNDARGEAIATGLEGGKKECLRHLRYPGLMERLIRLGLYDPESMEAVTMPSFDFPAPSRGLHEDLDQ